MSDRVSKLKAQFNRSHISDRDFREAAEYLRALRGRRSIVVQRALLMSAIVAYARPFTPNREGLHRGATAMLNVNLKKIFGIEEQTLHTALIQLRNEGLAHSDFDRKPTGRVSGVSSGFMVSSKPFDVLSERINRSSFQAMCEKMSSYCNQRLFELNHQINQFE